MDLNYDPPVLTIKICNSQPVELIDLTNSFLSFGEEYNRFLDLYPEHAGPKETKLFIKEIKTGSIVTDLIAYAPYAVPFIEHANTIIAFAKFISSVYGYLLGKNKEKLNISGNDFENLSNFLEPIAKDNAAQLNCHTTVNGNVNVFLTINSVEANAIQNRAKKEIETLKETEKGIKEKVLLYWYQARNDLKSNAGDRAIIESIQSAPVKAIFLNDSVKSKMIYDSDNPFTSAYVVDVEVGTIRGKPTIYKILNIHERIDRLPE